MKQPFGTGRSAEVSEAELIAVQSNTDLARIIESMRSDLLAHPDEWENATLGRFLDALAAVVEAAPHAVRALDEAEPTAAEWRRLARLLVYASGYE